MTTDYKSTLNLPNTPFPMKASLTRLEPDLLERWQTQNIYRQIQEKNKGKQSYILHDGPPYANGNIHIGHALNKILKDIIVKARSMQGYYAPYVPGWDCHGLPIEHQVDKNLGDKKYEVSKEEKRKLCREYAGKFIDIQREEFKRLGVFGDWQRPYLTMDYSYEAAIVRELGIFAKNGSLYKGKKPIHWCSSCETALAEAEVEYADKESPSVYVKFPVDNPGEKFPELGGKPVSVVIWTTTPWTLPANLAVCLHPDFDYSLIDTGNGEVLIVASELAEQCLSKFGITDSPTLKTVRGGELEGIKCRHPFVERKVPIILGDHVTLDAGTGCVHTAPGHGQEDYEIGLKYSLDIYNPVNNQGKFTAQVPEFEGQYVFKANAGIIELLKQKGALLAGENIRHSYPHCWRCKNPVIFRATEQWFISMEKNDLKKKALEWIDKVQWIPSWGRDRILGMMENRPDWCISRQRSWGVPITVFTCTKCFYTLKDQSVINHVADLMEKEGADVWFTKSASELLPAGTTCPVCDATEFTKDNNILDVWFDSGASQAAVLKQREDLSWPADLYLEGSDQHRGWFNSSLMVSLSSTGQAPFRSVLTHGFVVDGAGKKMSKSLGNVVTPQEVINQFGADILRLWVAAEDYRDDIRISKEILNQLSEAYRKIRNTCRYILGNLSDFDPAKDIVEDKGLSELDLWAMDRLQQLIQKVGKAYDNFEFHAVYHALNNFCSVEMSAFYLDILKDRLYTSGKNSPDRKAAQTVMYRIIHAMTRLMAPILSFTAEEVWSYLPGNADTGSVHLADFPKVEDKYVNEGLRNRWDRIQAVRTAAAKVLEAARRDKVIGHSLDAKVELCADGGLKEFLAPYAERLAEIFIVSSVELKGLEAAPESAVGSDEVEGLKIAVSSAPGAKCERCWTYSVLVGKDSEHPSLCGRCSAVVRETAVAPLPER
ncbi:MAG: isoleucine--tRNA ligase [Nitrospirota bacterium]|nr:isoleucine--tRNA ligase [Nitrospirota bacterium]